MINVRVTMHELVVFVCLEFAEMCIIIYQSLSFSTAFTHLLLVLPFVLQRASGDLFGSDPFAPSPSAKGRSESPRPALPPKQKKAPPPRPAPPKKSPASSPSRPGKPDPFGSAFPNDPFGSADPFSGSVSGGGGDGFANFADFSPSKVGRQ